MAGEVTGIALGMIETRGLVPAIEAADAMTKAAEGSSKANGYTVGMMSGDDRRRTAADPRN